MRAAYILRRLLYSAAAFGISVTIAFALLHFMPGDYITQYLEQIYVIAPPEIVRAYNRVYGLDRPLIEQYFSYFLGVLQGDWGYSLSYSRPVLAVIGEKLVWTLVIILPATVLAIIVGIVVGAYSGWKRGSKIDLALLNGMIFLRAIPSYWLALMILLIFAYYLGLFPLGGYVGLSALDTGIDPLDVMNHAALPIFTLFLFSVTGTYYLMRNSMLMTAGEDYIVTARAKGLDELTILRKHALRNAMLPMVTSIALECAGMITGSIFVETIFSWPGLGMLTFEALKVRDIPLLQGILLIDTLLVIVANIAADLIYPLVDPRVEVGDGART
ncbi:MAG: peptide/nickel transport system permease protein [Methanofollis sp.]|nr:peptide/nickel transport system permease protein [Methanofollis sp.]